jgi:hypothetical protein
MKSRLKPFHLGGAGIETVLVSCCGSEYFSDPDAPFEQVFNKNTTETGSKFSRIYRQLFK